MPNVMKSPQSLSERRGECQGSGWERGHPLALPAKMLVPDHRGSSPRVSKGAVFTPTA
jgi:hypothetical protein